MSRGDTVGAAEVAARSVHVLDAGAGDVATRALAGDPVPVPVSVVRGRGLEAATVAQTRLVIAAPFAHEDVVVLAVAVEVPAADNRPPAVVEVAPEPHPLSHRFRTPSEFS
jgi:hypothetical protein